MGSSKELVLFDADNNIKVKHTETTTVPKLPKVYLPDTNSYFDEERLQRHATKLKADIEAEVEEFN